MMSSVLVAVATSVPEASVTMPSVNAAREPDLTTVPVAVSTPLDERTGLRKFTLSSSDVNPLPWGIVVWTAQPTAASSSVHTTPPQTVPNEL